MQDYTAEGRDGDSEETHCDDLHQRREGDTDRDECRTDEDDTDDGAESPRAVTEVSAGQSHRDREDEPGAVEVDRCQSDDDAVEPERQVEMGQQECDRANRDVGEASIDSGLWEH